MKVRLRYIAHARSGDKGDTANVGVIAWDPKWYPLLARLLTTERVAAHFRGAIGGPVQRYELPNLYALNFLLHSRGMTLDDVRVVPVGRAIAAIASIEQGRIDAGFVIPGALAVLRRRVPEGATSAP